jgi:hypothetical protein
VPPGHPVYHPVFSFCLGGRWSGNGIDPCQLDAHCVGGTGNAVPTCIAYAGLGAACDAVTNVCDPLLACTNGVCVAMTTGADCGD